MVRKATPAVHDDAEITVRRCCVVVAKVPDHTWHVDLTAVPTGAGFWVPWFPFSDPQRWPFCAWVAVLQGHAVVLVGTPFESRPPIPDPHRFLARTRK